MRRIPTVSLFLVVWATGAASAQEISRDQFRTEFNKGIELRDDKLVDRAVKRGSRHAADYFEELSFEAQKRVAGAAEKCAALTASWQRSFGSQETLEQLHRWVDGCSPNTYEILQRTRANATKVWQDYEQVIATDGRKNDYLGIVQDFATLARTAEGIGHYLVAADCWGLASVAGTKMPDKSVEQRREMAETIERFLAARQRWGYTFDDHYVRNHEFVKAERLRIEEAQREADKRAAAGYRDDIKGVDALVMPNVAPVRAALKFAPLVAAGTEIDYGPKGGPVPAFWWIVPVGRVDQSRKVDWFRARELYLRRTSASKFTVGFGPDDAEHAVPVEVSPKAKPSLFWLDAEKQRSYAMQFWIGSEREMINEAECNLAPSTEVANVYYRSAASWTTKVGDETIVLYDDNASGAPGDADPFAAEFKSPMLGDHDGEGTLVPLLDSMRIGKGPRVPFSEFVKLAGGWHHLQKDQADQIAVRPLNPEFFKTGRIRLNWSGPKPTAPVQLVVQGRGDFRTAMFDLASGKEVEVPAGEYTVIFGRILQGKSPRVQTATLYAGDSKPFTVEPGQTHTLAMGAPFQLRFVRQGDQDVTIDALKIHLAEASGCVLTEFHGISLACDVLAARDDSGKGYKEVGEFVRFTNPELVNKAANRHAKVGLMAACFPMPEGYKEGPLALSLKLPAAGMKVALAIKKHPLFGPVQSAWQ